MIDEFRSLFPKFDHDIDNIDEIEDDLQRSSIVNALVNDIRGAHCPKVIGVYGWWGSGKSYLLSLAIKQLLDGNHDSKLQVIVVTYNPWRYETEGNLAGGLIKALYEVDKKFTKRNPDFDSEKGYKEVALSILRYLAKISKFVPVYGEIISGVAEPTIDLVEGITDRQGAFKQEEIHDVDTIQNKMQELVDKILESARRVDKTKEYRLVVFIDDLDRCSPANMVRLLEWLKVHLNARNCTYVLALDHVAAARAIVGQYKEYLENDIDLAYGLRYLEKLVENEYELGVSNFAERMALRQIDPSSNFTKISQMAVKLSGGDFPGVNSIDELMKLRSLLNPRTMLKIAYKFKRAMNVLDMPEAIELRTQLPSSYPFWLIMLTAMYYSIDPSMIDDFVRGRGNIYQLIKNPGSISTEQWGRGPVREFCQFADRLGATSSSSLQLPPNEILFKLMSVIRENSYAK